MRPPMRRVNYKVRDKVEVCSKEEGFVGSYFKATIISCLENEEYVVLYNFSDINPLFYVFCSDN